MLINKMSPDKNFAEPDRVRTFNTKSTRSRVFR
jgi:hypothetical protein